jgi:antirestriction protein ArdC
LRPQELYQSVTDQIIRDLESGVPPWVRPWKLGNSGGIMPINAATGRAYSGVNIPILWHAQRVRGYPSPRWATYKQVLPLDAHVRKGEHGTTVVFTKRVTIKKDDEDEKQLSVLRTYKVFNVAQIDGLPEAPVAPYTAPQGAVDRFIDSTHADLRYGGDRAFYAPAHDFIQLPPRGAFETESHFHATALHELCHWSGAKPRLDRDLKGRFGTKAYAAEELIAELGAAFLCAHLGVEGRLRHAEYIGNWLELLRDDNRAVFTASSKASAAAEYLRTFTEQVQEAA